MSETAPPDNQRIDRWLWCARFFKTRTLAAKFVTANSVRMTRGGENSRIDKPSYAIRSGDTLVFSAHNRLRIIDVVQCALRRGPASEAATLYQDRSPPPAPKPKKSALSREPGAGRPTKKDRRAIDALKSPRS